MDKNKILANYQSFNAQQWFDFECQGLITLEEVKAELAKTNVALDAKVRKEWQTLRNQRALEDDAMWQQILDKKESGTKLAVGDYTNYIAKFPNGKHRTEADMAIAAIIAEQQAEIGKRTEKLNNIKRDRNCYRPETILQDLNNGVISEKDLINHCNIPHSIVNKIKKFRSSEIKLGKTPTEIPNGFTEVYFWGVINSGKTCALSAILRTADLEGYLKTGTGDGLGYLNDLVDIFKENIGFLPESTSSKNIQYLPFTLRKDGDKFPRSVSLIELSGEIVQYFVSVNEGRPITEDLQSTFDTLTSFLKGKNRKIHFFFVDYNPEAISTHNRAQSVYMSETMKWIEKERIFANNTDAIYLVITKSDIIEGYYDADKTKLTSNINKFLDEKFPSFRKNLHNLCKDEKINGGDFEIIPFSIGDVYFSRICQLNREPSKIIINRLFKIQPQRDNILDKLMR